MTDSPGAGCHSIAACFPAPSKDHPPALSGWPRPRIGAHQGAPALNVPVLKEEP
jgi:hypothetical protein